MSDRPDDAPAPMDARIRAAADLLEAIAADRALLAETSPEERLRLLRAAGEVSRPDALARRRMVLATRRERKAAKVERAERALTETGIRKLREQPVFSTPRLFAPADFEQRDVTDEPGPRGELLRLQARLPGAAPLLRPALPAVRGAELLQAHRDGRPARARGAAHRRPGQDRLPGGDQAAARRRRADRHHPLPARLGRALRGEPDFAEWGDRLRSSGWTCATRPASRPSASQLLATRRGSTSSSTTPARRCAGRRTSTAHMMEGETAALHSLPGRVARLLGSYDAAGARSCCRAASRRGARPPRPAPWG
jgi:hypothetical protein